MVYVVVVVILVAIALSFQDRRWRCPACDFTTYDESEAQKHTAAHARHKPAYK